MANDMVKSFKQEANEMKTLLALSNGQAEVVNKQNVKKLRWTLPEMK